MIDLKELMDYCQAEAISNKLQPTEESVWRDFCRKYSRFFHTPLYLVLDMEVEHVILNVYEQEYDKIDLEDYQKLEIVMDTLKLIEDPEYEKVKTQEQEDFDRKAEQEEEERIKAGRAIHPVLQRKLDQNKAAEAIKDLPKEGSINMDYFKSNLKDET